MADFAYVEAQLAAFDPDTRKSLKSIFQYLMKNLRIGRVINNDPSENFAAGFFSGTTPSIANTEFAIAHSFDRTPYLLLPVLPLDVVGAKLVRLTVSRPADATKVYLKSPDTDAPVFLYLEG